MERTPIASKATRHQFHREKGDACRSDVADRGGIAQRIGEPDDRLIAPELRTVGRHRANLQNDVGRGEDRGARRNLRSARQR